MPTIEVIKTKNGYWVNLDKNCCDPITYNGEVCYFKTPKEALEAATNDTNFIDQMLEILDNAENCTE